MTSILLALWGLFWVSPQAPCGEEDFLAHPRRSIQLGQIRPGNRLIFEYRCQTKGSRKTMDRDVGIRHAVVFEVDPESHAFYFQDEALLRAKVYVSRHCRCTPLVYDHLKGTVEGHRKASGQWEVTIDLTAMDEQGKEMARLSSTGMYQLP
jgi:hypothetical protein